MGINKRKQQFYKMGAQYTSSIATTPAESGASGCMMGSHLRDWDDVNGLPHFPSGTQSLLNKCLTPDVWEKMHSQRDKYGFSFKQAIFSGCKWTNSGVGVYAGSHDSYYSMAPLFDKIIEKYHGHGKTHQEIADKYFVQIRGIHGEHTETDDGVFDISNLRRLGRNEVQLVQDMYDGVKAMIRAEKSL